MKNIQNKLTIVITTFNRYPYLLRLLKFLLLYSTPYKILILDSSTDIISDNNLREILTNERIRLCKYDPNILVNDKKTKGVMLVETDYFVFCGDDDFVIPSSLNECIEFLDKRLDYSAAEGLFFSHGSYEISQKDGFIFNLLTPLNNKHREGENAFQRITNYFTYSSHYANMAVLRSRLMQIVYSDSNLVKNNLGNNAFIYETIITCILLIHGKIKTFPSFFSSYESHIKFKSLYQIMSPKEVYSDKAMKVTIDLITQHLTKYKKVSISEAEYFAKKEIGELFSEEKNISRHKNQKEDQHLMRLLKKIKRKLRIRTRSRVLFNYLLYQGCHPSIYPDYLADFKKVREAVFSACISSDKL